MFLKVLSWRHNIYIVPKVTRKSWNNSHRNAFSLLLFSVYYFLFCFMCFKCLLGSIRMTSWLLLIVIHSVKNISLHSLLYNVTKLDILTLLSQYLEQCSKKYLFNEEMNTHYNSKSVTQGQTWGIGMNRRKKRNKRKIQSLVGRLGRGQRKDILPQPKKGSMPAAVFWIWHSVTFGVLGCPHTFHCDQS